MTWTPVGPAFSDLTGVQNVPWADSTDPPNPPAPTPSFDDPPWHTAARLLTGTFSPGATPGFASGSNGTVFTSMGTSTTHGGISDFIPLVAGENAIVRTDFIPTMFHPADYNRDGTVNAGDYPVWRNNKGTSGPDGDGTGPVGVPDGMVDLLDYSFWKLHYGTVGPGTGSGSGGAIAGLAVPEPQSAALLAMGIAAAALRRARSWPARGRTAQKRHFRRGGTDEMAGLPAARHTGHVPERAGFCRVSVAPDGNYEKTDFRRGNCLTAWKWPNIMPQGSARGCDRTDWGDLRVYSSEVCQFAEISELSAR
jgi:hypothetical protein